MYVLPWYGSRGTARKPKVAVAPNVIVDVYKTLRAFIKRMSTSNMQHMCARTKEESFIQETYFKNWVYSTGTVTDFHPKNIRRYFVAGDQGFAVGGVLDPSKFAGERIFYLILICTRDTSRGVGTRLMTAVEKEAKENLNCDRIWLSSVEDRTWIYSRWGFRFGPYCPETSQDPLHVPLRVGRTLKIVSHKAPLRSQIPILNRNGKPTGRMNPLPPRFYHVRGVHRDQSRSDGYLMTKCLRGHAAVSKKRHRPSEWSNDV